jgi:hypothetical protein
MVRVRHAGCLAWDSLRRVCQRSRASVRVVVRLSLVGYREIRAIRSLEEAGRELRAKKVSEWGCVIRQW